MDKTSHNGDILTAALFYAQRGWAVLPLKPCDKVPITQHGVKDATTDVETIRRWWSTQPTANVGIATGTVSGFIVLDVDGAEGRQSLDGRAIPPTVVAKTGKGMHYLFAHPGGKVRNFVRRLPGLDLRGDGGYIVAPPSLHPSGRRYRWLIAPEDEDPAPCPDWLLALLPAPAEKQSIVSPVGGKIRQGERNDKLTSLAGTMRRRGMTEAEILTALLAVNENRCEPPLTRPEVERIARYEPAEAIADYHLSDLGNARRLIARHGTDLRYCQVWGRWLVWDGTRWATDETGEVMRRAKDTVASIYVEAARTPDDDRRKAVAKHALRSESAQRLRAMVTLAESEPQVVARPDDFDCDLWLFNVLNGTLDLRTGELLPHQRDHLIMKQAPLIYDPEATCPLWDAFLERIMDGNEALIGFLQRAVGYALTGDTSEQCLFILYGTGANGKTTFLQTISAMMGDYAQQTPTETLLIKRGDNIPNDVARLRGSRLVTAVEAEEGRRLAESLVKQMTGGDKLAARFLHAEWFEFRPTFKVFLGTNHKPTIRGTDHAIWRRIRLIPFTVTIPEAEQDKELAVKLRTELPGILAWAVRGCLAWQRDGLGMPEEVQRATEDYRSEMDVLGSFLEDCCIITDGAMTQASVLYQAYRDWCEENGERPVTGTRFGRRMTERGFDKVRDTYVYYLGLGLLTDTEQEIPV